MAYENMSDEELYMYAESKLKNNQFRVLIGFLTIPILIGIFLIIQAQIRSAQGIKAKRALMKRQKEQQMSQVRHQQSFIPPQGN